MKMTTRPGRILGCVTSLALLLGAADAADTSAPSCRPPYKTVENGAFGAIMGVFSPPRHDCCSRRHPLPRVWTGP